MSKNQFPKGWDEKRVRELIRHFDSQTEEEAIAEDEAAYDDPGYEMIAVPRELVPDVQQLISKRKRRK